MSGQTVLWLRRLCYPLGGTQLWIQVKAIVRKDADILKLKKVFEKSESELAAMLEFVVIPDLAAPNAFGPAILEGVDHIIHTASVVPRPSDDFIRDFFEPVIDMNSNILTAARDTPSVKRVVITSSLGAYITMQDFASGKLKDVYRADDDTNHYPIDAPFPNANIAYTASKSFQLDTIQTFIEKEKPKFEVVIIAPPFILGKNRLATKAEDYSHASTNKIVLNLLATGKPQPFLVTSCVSLQDVAKLHVLGLNSTVPPGRYLAACGGLEGVNWYQAFDVVKKDFPDLAAKYPEPEEKAHIFHCATDVSKTEKVFGIKFRSYEEQVRDVVSSYLALVKDEESV